MPKMFSSIVSNDVPLFVCPRGKSRHDERFLCSETSLGPRSLFVRYGGGCFSSLGKLRSLPVSSFPLILIWILILKWFCSRLDLSIAFYRACLLLFFLFSPTSQRHQNLLALCIALFKPTPAQENLTSSHFAAHIDQYRISCLVPSSAHWVCSSYRVIPETGSKPVTSFSEATGPQRVLEYLR